MQPNYLYCQLGLFQTEVLVWTTLVLYSMNRTPETSIIYCVQEIIIIAYYQAPKRAVYCQNANKRQ